MNVSQELSKKKKSARREWLAENRGAITRVCEEFGLSHSFVSGIFWSSGNMRSGSLRVESRFAELGVPGFSVAETTEARR